MSTPLATRVRLKLKKIALDITQPAPEREWRRMWPIFDSIEGWLTHAEGKWLFDAARSLSDGANIVEIGSYKGRSTCCLALGCRRSDRRVFAVDSFDGGSDLPRDNSFPAFLENLKRCGVLSYVNAVTGLSGDVAKDWKKPIQMLFIDGSHNYEEVLADFIGFFPHVEYGGIVAFHDVDETKPGVLKVWNETAKCQLTGIGYCERLGYGRKSQGNSQPVL
jgi:predicted O-methyltransferase YrrM